MTKDIYFEMPVRVINTDTQMSYCWMVANQQHASDAEKKFVNQHFNMWDFKAACSN